MGLELRMDNLSEILKSTYSSDIEAINDIDMKLVDWSQGDKDQSFGQYLSSLFPNAEIPNEILEEDDSYIVFIYFIDKIEEINF